MLLETILCEFWQICATGNALMLLETILFKFGQICATWTDMCNRKCSYAARKGLKWVWTDLRHRKCSYAAGNDFMRVWTDLCDRKCSYAAGNNFMRVQTNLCNRESFLLAGTPFWILPPKFAQECAEPFCKYSDDSSQCTAKDSLEKGCSWPPEAISYGEWHIRGLVLTCPISPTPWTRSGRPLGPNSYQPSSY